MAFVEALRSDRVASDLGIWVCPAALPAVMHVQIKPTSGFVEMGLANRSLCKTDVTILQMVAYWCGVVAVLNSQKHGINSSHKATQRWLQESTLKWLKGHSSSRALPVTCVTSRHTVCDSHSGSQDATRTATCCKLSDNHYTATKSWPRQQRCGTSRKSLMKVPKISDVYRLIWDPRIDWKQVFCYAHLSPQVFCIYFHEIPDVKLKWGPRTS